MDNKKETPKESKKNDEKNASENNIKISNDVIEMIAGVAANEVQGVSEMTGGFAGGITEILSGKKNYSKGIKVNINESSVIIDVNIIVEYGARIPDVAFEIQKRVKTAVENMTGLNVEEVNVHVQGVALPDSKKKSDESKEKSEHKTEEKDKNQKKQNSKK
jgi:uncharacterized alkaline shock family protein YloU